jgi:phytoene synthase
VNDLTGSYDWCRQITRIEAKNFYYGFITLPIKKRLAIYASYAFCRLCDDAADENYPVDKKLKLLKDIRGNLSESYAGRPLGPVFTALADTASSYHIPEELYQEIITGVETDLSRNRYSNFDELRSYCYGVASAVGLICIEILGYSDPSAKTYATNLGLAMQLTNIIRDIKEDLGRDRIYIPQDEISRFGYSEDRLIGANMDQQFLSLMRFQVDRAREYFADGLKLIPLLPFRARPCPAVLARLYMRVLDVIEDRNFNVFDGRISLTGREKLYITARTWMGNLLPVTHPSVTE